MTAPPPQCRTGKRYEAHQRSLWDKSTPKPDAVEATSRVAPFLLTQVHFSSLEVAQVALRLWHLPPYSLDGARENMDHDRKVVLGQAVLERLKALDRVERQLLDLAKAMLEAYDHALYGMDLLAVGTVNRALAHLAGFRMLIEKRNLVCAGSILRLQIDTALRFHAAFLVEKPHDFALAVLSGTPIRQMKDREGHKLTDRHLLEKLSAEAEWLPRVYRETSGYIHLSEKHLFSAFSPGEDGRVTMKMAAADKPLPDSIYLEAIDAFIATTGLFMKYLHGWGFTKANPELVQKWREERGRVWSDAPSKRLQPAAARAMMKPPRLNRAR